MFYKKINTKNRKEMIEFLTSHFRYNTMSSWNRSTSYANNMKIHNIGLSPKQLDVAYDLLNITDDSPDTIISKFAIKHEYLWQAKFNGRSRGYLVLYQGGRKELDYKTRCNTCGKLTWYDTEQQCHVTGEKGRCCGILRILKSPVSKIFTYSGKSVDMDEDFKEFSLADLRNRVKLIQDFDKLCDDIVNNFKYLCNNFHTEDKEITIPKTIKVLVSNT